MAVAVAPVMPARAHSVPGATQNKRALFAAAGIATDPHDTITVPQGSASPFPLTNADGFQLGRSSAVPPAFVVEGSKSFTAGGIVGYHWQYGGFVLGFEGDVAWKKFGASNSETTQSFADYPAIFLTETAQRVENFSGRVGQDWDASLRARFGTFITPTTLTYLTGGFAIGGVNGAFGYLGSVCDLDCGYVNHITTGADSWRDTRIGWTIGSGVETAIGGGWKVRAEYRYTDLGSFTHDVALTRTCSGIAAVVCGTTPNAGPAFAPVYQQASFQTVRLGLVYSFDGLDLGGFIGASGS
jgi:outer membrane immunogenic protein